ncbi:MAG: hypothetical protein LBQ50_10880 [Planctomycetaceae bacterium]|jgi:DNA repair exonuclease SbcCD ATPase subunit|nr:hypothetical protein [Planctomycetaceae bacterium]
MSNVQELLSRHENSSISSELFELLDALLYWATQSPLKTGTTVPEKRSVEERLRDGPKPSKGAKKESADTSGTILLADAMRLTALAFRLLPMNNQNEVSDKMINFAKKIGEKVTERHSELQTLIEISERQINEIKQKENELEKIRITIQERKKLWDTNQIEYNTLKKNIGDWEQSITSIETQIKLQNDKKRDLTDKKKLIEEQQTQIDEEQKNLDTLRDQIGDFDKRLEEIKQQCVKAQEELSKKEGEKSKIKSDIAQIEKRKTETEKLIEDLKRDGAATELLKRIQAVWKQLPEDLLETNNVEPAWNLQPDDLLETNSDELEL